MEEKDLQQPVVTVDGELKQAKEKKEKVAKEKPAKKEKASAGLNEPRVREFEQLQLPEVTEEGVKGLKQKNKIQKQMTSKYSKEILEGKIVSTTGNKPDIEKNVIELYNVKRWYVTGDMLTPVLRGVDLKLEKGKFIVILGPSGSGKTTLLNTISGLDKTSEGDVFVLGSNLSLLKDSHLTKFRRENVGFIFQQYNLLSNLTAKENAEVGENLSKSKENKMSIEEIFKTIGMEEQMNKYPHQMSGGQQQRVSIARALAKNPEILFGDEPTGALDEEMGRKVLDILVDVKEKYNTTVIIVTHNPNISEIGDTVIHVRNGLIDEIKHNAKPKKPSEIDWS
ncbi:ABC transporter ATP-binding protein [Spiroplasma endosymbiont of Diplazon laetatorius]|uniref:ABC transporter ATP-binding protein n=1 Tax=Spiroplasma endosymbiont of Diplazon laetatorius TaxID=3066322 RepID=UPI0030D62C6C